MGASRPIDDERWETYFTHRDSGHSVEQSARASRIDPRTAYRFESGDPNSSGADYARRSGRDQVAGKLIVGALPRAAKSALRSFPDFRLRYFGRTSTPWQAEAAKTMMALAATPEREFVVVNSPPGGGKSTLFTHDIPAWMLARNRAIRIQFGSRTERQARMYVNRLKRTLEREAPMRADAQSMDRAISTDAKATLPGDFGPFKPDGRGDLWRAEAFVVRQTNGTAPDDKEPSVSAWGMDSGFLGGRFDVIVWDDLVDRKGLRSKEAFDAMVEWWTTEAETRLEPGGLLVLQGQRMGPDDLYRYCLDTTDIDGVNKYSHIVYRAHDQQRCTGKHGPGMKPWPDSCLLDPYRLPWKLLATIKANEPRVFEIQYQQNDGDAASLLVDPVWITGGTDSTGYAAPGCLDDTRSRGTTTIGAGTGWSVLSVDPSPTEKWGITWWIMHPFENRYQLVDLWSRRLGSEQFLSLDFTTDRYSGLLEDIYNRSVGISHPLTGVVLEINAAQRYLLSQPHVQRWAQQRRVTLIPHTTSRNKTDPDYGVTSISDAFRQGRVSLPHADADSRIAVRALTHELITWPEGKTDDLVMSTWFALRAVTMNTLAVRAEGTRFDRPSWLHGTTRGLAYAR